MRAGKKTAMPVEKSSQAQRIKQCFAGPPAWVIPHLLVNPLLKVVEGALSLTAMVENTHSPK